MFKQTLMYNYNFIVFLSIFSGTSFWSFWRFGHESTQIYWSYGNRVCQHYPCLPLLWSTWLYFSLSIKILLITTKFSNMWSKILRNTEPIPSQESKTLLFHCQFSRFRVLNWRCVSILYVVDEIYVDVLEKVWYVVKLLCSIPFRIWLCCQGKLQSNDRFSLNLLPT